MGHSVAGVDGAKPEFRYYVHFFRKGNSWTAGYSGVIDYVEKRVVGKFKRLEDALVECDRLNREFLGDREVNF